MAMNVATRETAEYMVFFWIRTFRAPMMAIKAKI